MSGDVVIRVEGLGKKYIIGHENAGARGGGTLRDAITRAGRGFARALKETARGGALVAGDTTEEFWALKDVSFEVSRGEVLGIIGRNGAGKSTLLKVLSRITDPSEGRVTINGRVASLLEVGTGFHPELTGKENIFLNGAILGMTRAEIRRKFDEIVAFAEVEKFLDTPVKRYSSGMYVRLAFAVAAHMEPDILVIDEVLAVGDAEFQKKSLGKMSSIASGGRTVLFVSHNMGIIERLCERIVCLDHGVAVGVYDDVRLGIITYLNQAREKSGSSVWRRSEQSRKNGYFTPEAVSISSAHANSPLDGPFSNASDLVVDIDGNVANNDPALNVGIAVYTEEGTLLFWSFATDGAEGEWPELARGPIRLRVTIPRRLLNEGDYRLELLASLHFRQWLIAPGGDAPAVAFSIQGGLSDSPLWDRKRPGLLGPELAWETRA